MDPRPDMRPRFALNLSQDGIGLLHRAKRGWTLVGEAAVEAEDLDDTLKMLRETARGLEPSGVRSILVIPDSQILYTRLPIGPDPEAAIRAGLDGLTPYPVADLVFDWEDAGDGTAHVAVVAHETLDEANSFASFYKFNPVAYCAAPQGGQRPAAPWFGATGAASELLAPGEAVEREAEPVRAARRMPNPAMPEDVEDRPTDSVAPAPEEIETQPPAPVPAPEPAPQAAEAPLPEPPEAPEPDPEPARTHMSPLPPPQTRPAFSTARDRSRTDPAPVAAPEVSARLTLREAAATLQAPATPPDAGVTGASAPEIDPPAPPKPKAGTKPGSKAPKAPKAPAATRDTTALAPAPKRAVAAPRVTEIAPPQPMITAPPKTEAEALTVFGARGREAERAGLARRLALIAALLLVVAGGALAYWAVTRPAETVSGTAPTEAPAQVAALAPPAPRPEAQAIAVPQPLASDPEPAPEPEAAQMAAPPAQAAAPAQPATPEGLAQPAGRADTAPVLPPETALAALPARPDGPATAQPDTAPLIDTTPARPRPAPEPLTEDSARAAYAATGIWMWPPEVPDAPRQDRLDDLYTAAIDPTIRSEDATALPALPALDTDQPLPQRAAPPAPGQVFALDAEGRVTPSAEGTPHPDGFLVYAGRPELAPPPRPADDRGQTAQEAAEADALRAELAAFRPPPRPENLAERRERAGAGGYSLDELRAYRPRPRPDTVPDTAPEAATGDAPDRFADEGDVNGPLVMALSLQPRARPAEAAAAALKARETAPAATPAAQVVAPRIPSSASVAKQATIDNALNLREINLIGVYGSASGRRALVRLASGRYVKVEVGDRLDGGKVAAIGDDSLSYVKSGRTIILDMPDRG